MPMHREIYKKKGIKTRGTNKTTKIGINKMQINLEQNRASNTQVVK